VTLFGFEISRTKAVTSVTTQGTLATVSNRGWYRILESWAGAWQHNVEVTVGNVSTNPTLFTCVTLIAGTVAKMRLRLVQQDRAGIWNEVDVPAFSPVLKQPNHYQTPQQFIEHWMLSKLLNGNAYTLKVRDNRNVVRAMYVLDPTQVTPLVAPSGDVFYQLGRDDLSLLPDAKGYVVPASEIIHDRFNCLFHGLVGLSPIYACGAAAVQGLNIQNNSTNFFGNGSRPGGVLTAPGAISQDTATRLKAYFDENFTGDNAGKVAVMGDGLKYEPMAMSANDSQLIEQLKWTAEQIASAYKVPFFMVSSATYPPYNSVGTLQTMFYSMCIQELSEAVEHCLDRGLGLTSGDVASERYGTEFDRDDLFTMDMGTLMTTLETGKNYLTPDEGRRRLNLPAVPGGAAVYRQQQDFSLEALAKRDAQADPFGPKTPPALPPAPSSDEESDDTKALLLRYRAMAAAEQYLEKIAA
jgi:HK97 family phage portal protein